MKKWIIIFSGLLMFNQALAQEQMDEKINEFSMDVQIRPRESTVMVHCFPALKGMTPQHLSIIVRAFR